MELKITKVEEKKGLLRVYTECKYGEDNLGLSLSQKYLDIDTEKPLWESEVKSLIEQKYGKQIKKIVMINDKDKKL